MSYTNKVVLITGGSSGIGAGAAILFAREAAKVAIVGRNETKLSKTAAECEKFGNKPLVIVADVTKDAKRIIDETIAAFGKIDVLINNAGISRPGCIADGKLIESYDALMDTNLRSAMNMTMLAAPHLKTTKGNIINISSVGGHRPPKSQLFTAYGVSKAALNHFTKAAAIELAPSGVRVNAVSPGPVKTDLIENSGSAASWDVFKSATLFGRVAEPEEIAELLLFLAGDKAKSITGSNYVSDNGYLLK
ncbi:hypothetical protein K1T71_011045 [Dendrolimus kikuchii]|uniref:Uncharacterized protein n=1 Tax=Dendrolimus kikuchii TaxID=765133 RepID=A0ACC1CN86_9NEOP|nr:hypothetical protein K1T71_011045 [Dendrolimus kikuchii]